MLPRGVLFERAVVRYSNGGATSMNLVFFVKEIVALVDGNG